jgi:hypothetical protein
VSDFVTTATSSNWNKRFGLEVCRLWRDLQVELRHRGATDRARHLHQQIHGCLGIAIGSDLPEKQLHFASYPTRSKRPDLLSLYDCDEARRPQRRSGRVSSKVELTPTEGENSEQAPPQVCKKQPELPPTDDEIVQLHIDAQHALSMGLRATASAVRSLSSAP